jgi:uncharacterized alpha-E superfamily protein
MLSRTADHLYWMSRYTERAENMARMLEVTYRMSLQQQTQVGYWGAVLGINGLEESYREKYGAINAGQVLRFMSVDLDNPSSILSCLRAARENCHAVRGTVTSEVWETINTTWLEGLETAKDLFQSSVQGSDMTKYFEWVKFRSHLSRGVTLGTMLQDDAFHFNRLGTFLERADNTARLLDVKFDELAPQSVAGDEYYEWGALLRSVSAFEIYRKVYRDVITPQRVAELLILREDMPRSLHSCMKEVHAILVLVANSRSSETIRRAGELDARLRYDRIEDIVDAGLHDFLGRFLDKTADLGHRIAQDFLVPVA